MPLNTSMIRVGANGNVYVAPVGTAAPTDLASAWPAGWVDLGYASDDGATFTLESDTEDVFGWQSFFSLRKIVTTRSLRVELELLQWSATTVKLALGGGSITVAGAVHTYTPPAPDFTDERAFGLEWRDGTKKYRLTVPKCLQAEEVEILLRRTEASKLPITLDALGQDGVDIFKLISDDTNLAAA